MLGAIAGDMIGSAYEHQPIKSEEFPLFGPACRFTDDTVMTVAVAHASVGTNGDPLKLETVCCILKKGEIGS